MNKPMLMDMTIRDFVDLVASDAPTPGGGSVAALTGVLGAALLTMVCRLGMGRKGLDQYQDVLVSVLERADTILSELSLLVDRDTDAFNQVMNAFKLPKTSSDEKATRNDAIQNAFHNAIEVPLEVARCCSLLLELSDKISNRYNTNTASDLGVSAQCSYVGTIGALMNVKINIQTIDDKEYYTKVIDEIEQTEKKSESLKTKLSMIISNHLPPAEPEA